MVQTGYAAAANTSGSSNLPNFSKISGSLLLEECKFMAITSNLKTYILIIVIIPVPTVDHCGHKNSNFSQKNIGQNGLT